MPEVNVCGAEAVRGAPIPYLAFRVYSPAFQTGIIQYRACVPLSYRDGERIGREWDWFREQFAVSGSDSELPDRVVAPASHLATVEKGTGVEQPSKHFRWCLR